MSISSTQIQSLSLEKIEKEEEIVCANPVALTALKIVGTPFILARLSLEAILLVPLSIITVPTYTGLKRIFIDKEAAKEFQIISSSANECSTEVQTLEFKILKLENEKSHIAKELRKLCNDSPFTRSFIAKKQAVEKDLDKTKHDLARFKNKYQKLNNKLATLTSQFDSMKKTQSRLNKIQSLSYHRLLRNLLSLQRIGKPLPWHAFLNMVVGRNQEKPSDKKTGLPLSYHKQTKRSWEELRSTKPSF